MKNIVYFIGVILVASFFIVSCDKESTPVHIESVWTNQVDTVTHVITSRARGSWIRLQGTGFNDLKQIRCNGVSVSFVTTYVTDNYITFKIPSDLTIPGDSTITVITSHGQDTYYPFVFK